MKFNLRLPSFVLFATETKDVDVLKVKEGSYLLVISASDQRIWLRELGILYIGIFEGQKQK